MDYNTMQNTLRSSTGWRKSIRSPNYYPACVEITTDLTGWVGIRDSKLAAGSPVLAITTEQWQSVVQSICTDELPA